MEPLLSIEGLDVDFDGASGSFALLDGIDLACGEGASIAIVGESGGGKTMVARSVLRLLPKRARIRSGRIRLRGIDLAALSEREMCSIRGARIGIVFQDPAAALDPVQTIGGALREALLLHASLSAREVRRRSLELLEEVALPGGREKLAEYPHRLSGGMRQRAMIAVALAARPELLLADEPTASLDRPREREILDLLDRLRNERGLSVVLITHDLRVAAERCDRVAVMYGGTIVEEGPAMTVLRTPSHPYTAALRACLEGRSPGRAGRLPTIPGSAPGRRRRTDSSCTFASRCPEVFDRCRRESPPAFTSGSVRVRCFLREA